MQHDCDLDVADKHHAQGIDDLSHQLRNRACKVGFHPGVEKQDNTCVSVTRSACYYLRIGGCAFIAVCLFVCILSQIFV